MNSVLKKAFEAASRLPERDQKQLAAAILEELAADKEWQTALARSPPGLERLADEALAEYREDLTEPLDPDAL